MNRATTVNPFTMELLGTQPHVVHRIILWLQQCAGSMGTLQSATQLCDMHSVNNSRVDRFICLQQ